MPRDEVMTSSQDIHEQLWTPQSSSCNISTPTKYIFTDILKPKLCGPTWSCPRVQLAKVISKANLPCICENGIYDVFMNTKF